MNVSFMLGAQGVQHAPGFMGRDIVLFLTPWVLIKVVHPGIFGGAGGCVTSSAFRLGISITVHKAIRADGRDY